MRFLLIDADPNGRRLVCDELAGSFPGSVLAEVSTKADLRLALARDRFDVAISEFNLGWGNGLEILAEVRVRQPDVPCIIFSSVDDVATVVEAMKAGFNDYVAKPSVERLALAVQTALMSSVPGVATAPTNSRQTVVPVPGHAATDRSGERLLQVGESDPPPADAGERQQAEGALAEREEALRLSEERYRQMFERNRAIKLLIDPETGLIVQANPAACGFYGYTAQQLQAMKIWQLNLLPEPQVRARMAQALSEQQSYFVFRHRLANGQIRDVEINASPLTLQGRSLLYSIVHDITDRRQAERTLWHHTKRLQILRDIDQAVLALKSPGDIAQTALRHLRQVVPARYGSVMLFDKSQGQAEILALETGTASRGGASQRIPLEDAWGPAEQWQNNVYLIDDVNTVENVTPAIEALQGEGVHAHLSVPLIAQGQLIGRLNLGSSKPRAFTLQHLDIARQVADSLAVAIENARLYESEQRARQVSDTLRSANVALTQSLDLDAVFQTLLEYIGRLVAYDSASIMLLNDDDRVTIHATSGYEQWVRPEELPALRDGMFDIEKTSSISQVLSSQTSLVIPDTTTYPGWEPRPASGHIRSWLGVPLVARGRVIGLCSIDKVRPDFFTHEHAQLIEGLAAQAAVAILNAQLYEQVRIGREQLQTLSRRLVEVQERERRHVARELHDEAGQVLTSLMVNLGLLEREGGYSQAIVAQLERMKKQVDGVLETLHRLAVDLRPASLDHLGLVAALRQYVETVERQSGLSVQFETLGLTSQRLPAEVETSLYRIIEEALTNVVRHAGASQAGLLLERRNGHLVVIIEDNGKGFDAETELRHGRLGLLAMRERAEMLGGQLVIESSPGHGSSVFIDIPWQPSR